MSNTFSPQQIKWLMRSQCPHVWRALRYGSQSVGMHLQEVCVECSTRRNRKTLVNFWEFDTHD